MIKLLMKAKEIMDEAKEVGIRLEFDVDIKEIEEVIKNTNEEKEAKIKAEKARLDKLRAYENKIKEGEKLVKMGVLSEDELKVIKQEYENFKKELDKDINSKTEEQPKVEEVKEEAEKADNDKHRQRHHRLLQGAVEQLGHPISDAYQPVPRRLRAEQEKAEYSMELKGHKAGI